MREITELWAFVGVDENGDQGVHLFQQGNSDFLGLAAERGMLLGLLCDLAAKSDERVELRRFVFAEVVEVFE